MVAASALFAAMGLCVGQAHHRDPGLSTLATSTVRALVNMALLVAMVRGDVRRLVGDARPALVLRGVFGAFALGLYFASISLLSVGEAAFLNQTSAAWVAAIAPWLLGERTSAAAWIAVLGSLGGTFLLAQSRPGADDLVGRVAGIVSGMMAAGAYLSIRKAATTNPPRVVVAWFTGIAAALGLVLMLATGARFPTDPVTLVWLVGSGVTATFAQLLMTEAYAIGPTASVAATGATSPALTALGGWLLLGQAPDAKGVVGMVVLFACGVLLPLAEARSSTRAAAG